MPATFGLPPRATPPRILLTCGDPAGIGPEVACRAWAATPLHGRARLRLIASQAWLAEIVGGRPGVPPLPFVPVEPADPRPSRAGEVLVIHPDDDASMTTAAAAGRATAHGGRAAVAALHTAQRLVMAGHADALVTGPLHKGALRAAGYDAPGHTELLARGCGLPDAAASMMLWLPRDGGEARAGLGVVHVTLHEPLREAIARLSSAGIAAAGLRLAPLLSALLDRSPRIAVAALNPHAGEGGLFGDEEDRLVVPAVERLRTAGIDASGPLPADTLFLRASRGEFDGVVALYHDQGHIPIKLLGMHRAVNITLGLPLVRTSVAHGTAFDIVATGRADPAGMLAALDAAVRLVEAGWSGLTDVPA